MKQLPATFRGRFTGVPVLLIFISVMLGGCATVEQQLTVRDISKSFEPGAFISTQTGAAVPFEALVSDLAAANIVYIGEKHTDPAHHAMQLRIIKALHERTPDLTVGMEMFDRSYQDVLDQWSAGALTEEQFLEKTHWYANWKFDFGLYRDILLFIRDRHIRVIGLNIPFHIPARIAVGGLDNLSDADRQYLPDHIDTSDPAHRAYVEKIFRFHHIRGREKFDYFYAAQCAWDDAMAERTAEYGKNGHMVVLAGNGHIIYKFGIPNRAYARSQVPFKTIYAAQAGDAAETAVADYIYAGPVPVRTKKRHGGF